jgi:hypothetical protein
MKAKIQKELIDYIALYIEGKQNPDKVQKMKKWIYEAIETFNRHERECRSA